MRRDSRRGSRRSLEVDPLEDRSLLSHFGWPVASLPESVPIVVAFTQASMPQGNYVREPVVVQFPAGPGLPDRALGGESQMGLVPGPGPGVGFVIPILRDMSLPLGGFDAGWRGPDGGLLGRPGPGFGSDFPVPGRLVAGDQQAVSAPFLAPDRPIPPPAAVRPDSGPTVPERSINLATLNPVEGISTLGGAEALVAHAPALPNQPVTSFISGIVVSVGQRVFAALVSLPLVQPGPTGPDSRAPVTAVTGLPIVEVSHASVTAPLEHHEPVPPDDPSPQGADLITRFSPFDLTPIEESFSRLVERIVSFDSAQELEANNVSPVLLIVGGLAAIEASRRWQRHRHGVGSGRSWVIRRSAMHHPI